MHSIRSTISRCFIFYHLSEIYLNQINIFNPLTYFYDKIFIFTKEKKSLSVKGTLQFDICITRRC